MERTQPQEYLYQLPRRNRKEVEFRDAVEDKQTLLNEPWSSYAMRQGYPSDRVGEEHTKWATETWAEFEDRIILRADHLDAFFRQQKTREDADARCREANALQSSKLVDSLMDREYAIRNAKIASIHTLFVDFEARQMEKMRVERAAEEDQETIGRQNCDGTEVSERQRVEEQFGTELQAVIDLLDARRRAQEEEERRLLEEQRRKAEELRLLEEQKKRDAEAAERARREAEEEAKRAERKRREEERKNKAKAEREARAKQMRSETQQETQQDAVEAKPLPSPRPSEPTAAAPADVIPKPPSAAEPPITFSPIIGETVSQLLSSATASLSINGWSAFVVMAQSKSVSLIVSQNGITMGSPAAATPNQVNGVGQVLSPGFALSRPGPASSLKEYQDEFVEVITDASADSKAASFMALTQGEWSGLLVMPATSVVCEKTPAPNNGETNMLVVVASPGTDTMLSPTVVRAIAEHVAAHFTPRLLELLSEQRAKMLGRQALEWLSITTACKNCTFALSNNFSAPSALTFVSATQSQQFVLGRSFTKEEETSSNTGLSFSLMEESMKTGQPEVAHISDVQDKATNKVNGNSVRFFGEPKSGSLLLCPVMRPAIPGTGQLFGVLYVDTFGDNDKTFNKADEDIIRTTAVLLADLLTPKRGDGEVVIQEATKVKLALEKDLFGEEPPLDSPILFLKHIWLKVNTDISQISANQLQELASYNHPPPIIPTTVSATLLVALGTNPKNLEAWEDIRKRVKPSLVEKILNFDPSDATKRKRAFFSRARKVTKGLSAHDVFTRGSYPASCFFTWTFVTTLIRKTSDEIRSLYQGCPALTPISLVTEQPTVAENSPAAPEEEDESTCDVVEDAKEDDADV